MTALLTAMVIALAPTPDAPSDAHTADLPGSDRYRHRGCHTHRCDRRMDRKVRRRIANRKWRTVVPYNAKLNRMARCESGGRWHIATGNGFFGGLQFVPSTWWSVGGRGMPHQASPLEQKYRAVLLIRREGFSPWPVCGYR